jgi:uncharacterized protein YbjT (DUF2867 family)
MILITGASGNVGREVLKQMIQSGRPIRAAFQSASKAATAPAGVETVILDYKQPETMSAALRDIERILSRKPTGFEQFARDYAQLFRSSSGAAG